MTKGSLQKALGGLNVIANEFLWVNTTDLGVANDKMCAAFKFILPGTCFGEVRLHDVDLWVKPAQNGDVCRVLIESDNLTETAFLETRNEILAYKASGSCNYDFFGRHTIR